ncbi:MAG: hypothetical protein LBL44_13270 [Treponema sp.]|jgi:hypothetical protein|nr:hypothetical protein [Treponema sp.]
MDILFYIQVNKWEEQLDSRKNAGLSTTETMIPRRTRLVRNVCIILALFSQLMAIGCKKADVVQEEREVQKTQETQGIRRVPPVNIKPLEWSIRSDDAVDINEYLAPNSDLQLSMLVEMKFFGKKLEHLALSERFSSLKRLKVGYNLRSVETKQLPRTLEILDLDGNKLTALDTKNLPESLKEISLAMNPIAETFEITPNMRNVRSLALSGSRVRKITGFENLISTELYLHFIQCPIEDPDVFLQLRNVKSLAFSVPAEYSKEDITALREKIKERNPAVERITIMPYQEGPDGDLLIYDGT